MNSPLSLLLPALLLFACAAPFPQLEQLEPLLPADAVLLGEQHDAAEHQQRHRDAVMLLAARGRLAAVALEMAEQGASSAGLARNAGEAAVRAALRWNDETWPWAAYGPVVMAAVGAGVPVLGANLPRDRMRAAMADASLDGLLPAHANAAQQQAIRQGHCGLLSEVQVGPMTRIQIARDRAMAGTVAAAAKPGQTVLLLAGSGHVDAALGVPQHLPPTLKVRSLEWPRQPPKKDYCGELRERMAPAPQQTQ